MAKAAKTECEISPPEELPSDERLRDALGISEEEIMGLRIKEIAQLLWRPQSMSTKAFNVRIARAIELYNSLKPADGAEAMLAQQMIGTHDAALECLRRAVLPNQTPEGRDMALRHAEKLMSLYTRQLETLNKNRGKGQQKVTVEHVHIEAGGQAIVGTIEASDQPRRAESARAIESKPAVPMDDSPASRPSKATRRRRK